MNSDLVQNSPVIFKYIPKEKNLYYNLIEREILLFNI